MFLGVSQILPVDLPPICSRGIRGRWALRCDGAGPGTEGPAEPVGSTYSHGLSSEELGLLSSELFPQAGLLAPLTDGETEAEGGGDGQVP